MNITLIAPPAAGKGTISKIICEKYNIPHISAGDLLRNTNDENIKQKLNNGEFISDDIITDLLFKRLENEDTKQGYVLDGFPRNINQAKIYDSYLHNIGKKQIVFVIDLPKKEAAKRIIGRKICPKCGAVYNDMFASLRPKQKDVCDNCNSNLIHRNDDNEEIFNKRYQTYLNETYPLVKHYENIAHHIKSMEETADTFEQIKTIIGGLHDNN